MVRALTSRGFTVLPPAEVMDAKHLTESDQSAHMKILHLYGHRAKIAHHQRNPDSASYGLTDPEVAALMGVDDLHRRCAELRACGLVELVRDKDRVACRRKTAGKGTRASLVHQITREGFAVLRSIEAKTKEKKTR